MDTDSFVIYVKTEDFYKDIAGNVKRWFDTFNMMKRMTDHFQLVEIKRKQFFKRENHNRILPGKPQYNFVCLELNDMHIDWMMILKRKKVRKNAQ